jgi:hypothetical protein
LDSRGLPLGIYTIVGASAVDWEAIALGSLGKAPFLYIGDVGANKRDRDHITVYRVAEPDVHAGDSGVQRALNDVVRYDLAYPRGETHDSEAIFVDPESNALYIVTKSETGRSGVFRAHLPDKPSSMIELQHELDLTFGETAIVGSERVTDASMAHDGRTLLIKTYTDAYAWVRPSGYSLRDALLQPPCRLPLTWEPQGESIAFASDDRGYLTLSEGLNQPLYFYERQ